MQNSLHKQIRYISGSQNKSKYLIRSLHFLYSALNRKRGDREMFPLENFIIELKR
jgi:hypothetical protein